MNSTFDRANLSVIRSRLFIRFSKDCPKCFGLVKQAVVLAEALQRCEAKIFLEKREVDPEKFRALDVSKTVVGAPEALKFGWERLHGEEISLRFAPGSRRHP